MNFVKGVIIGTVISAAIGIYMAYKGYGVWSLVGQQISLGIIQTIIFFYISLLYPLFYVLSHRLIKYFIYNHD